MLKLSEESPRLLIDEKLFKEVITNLAQNSLAAINERFPLDAVEPECESCREFNSGEIVIETFVKNEKYILTIADNGNGMDEKTLSRIFEPYYTTKANGTGLGLTMVYKIIKEFRGDINVDSVKGHGTVFTISIPIPQSGTPLLSNGREGA